jgi:hypothetical protein
VDADIVGLDVVGAAVGPILECNVIGLRVVGFAETGFTEVGLELGLLLEFETWFAYDSSASSSLDLGVNNEGSTPSLSSVRSNPTALNVMDTTITLDNAQDSAMSG